MNNTSTLQHIDTPYGQLFVQDWYPEASRIVPGLSPILLHHDSLGCVALWRDFPQQLANATGRRVIAYDRLGFGQSTPRTERAPNSFVHDEGAIIVPLLREALGLDRFVVMGHSVGGGMSVATAAAAGDVCDALITMAAQSWVEDRTAEGVRAARVSFAEPGQMERLARYHGARAPWVLSAWIDTWLHESFANWSLDDLLPRVQCPALIMHGDSDEYGSVAHPARIARQLTTPREVIILEGVGHVPHREQPDVVLSHVARFLAQLQRNPADA
ncbi:MAG: alpha/beta hydrolase [Gemmatimonadaceae bacterium]|nr:alpha/beta hydrolase [Gemmatimonadaceae bacterium]